MSDEPKTEHFRFTHDELAFSIKTDLVNGKVYRAGTAFGVPPGQVLVEDMTAEGN